MMWPSAADEAGAYLYKGEARIKRWSPKLAAALSEKRVQEVRICGDLPGLEPLVPFCDQITRVIIESDVGDLSALSRLTKLRALSLREGAAQIDFAQLKELDVLSISGDTPEFGNLAECRSLRLLRITGGGLRDMTPLSGLSHLQEFAISEAPLKSLEGIAGLKSLRRLVLQQLPLERLDDLRHLHQLEEVVLVLLRRVQSVGVLTELPALRKVDVYSCGKVSDVEKLGALTKLESLELNGIKLQSGAFLAGLTQLKSLKLMNAGKIPSLEFLRDMRALEVFMPADSTTIEDGDMSILLELPALRQTLYTQRRHYKPPNAVIKAALSERAGSKENGG
jgi:hypothetical protein